MVSEWRKGPPRTLALLTFQKGCCQEAGPEVFLVGWHTKKMRTGKRQVVSHLGELLVHLPLFSLLRHWSGSAVEFGACESVPFLASLEVTYSGRVEELHLEASVTTSGPSYCGLDPPVWPLKPWSPYVLSKYDTPVAWYGPGLEEWGTQGGGVVLTDRVCHLCG